MPESKSYSRIAKGHVNRRASPSWRWQVPEDSSRIVLDFAAGNLLDLLSLALVDKQFHSLAVHRLPLELRSFGIAASPHLIPCAVDLQKVLMPPVAQKMVELSKLALCVPCTSEEKASAHSHCDVFAPFGEDEVVLHCQGCNIPLLKANDVISSSYRIMTGPAFLTAMAYNITKSEETYEASYTTGEYTVRQISCARCLLQLGITYVGAMDIENEYKIGKFLLGQSLLVRPQCCLLRTQPLTAGIELPTSFCGRCQQTADRGALELVNYMTQGLKDLRRTRKLCEILWSQRRLQGMPENDGLPSRGRVLAPRPAAVISWCFPSLRSHHSAAATSEQQFASRVRPSPSVERMVPPRVNPSWQDILKELLGMLRCLQPAIQEIEHPYNALTAVVRFVGTFCRAAQNFAPRGASGPKRVSSLLQLLPALIVPGRRDSSYTAGALASAAVRKEWFASPHPSHPGRDLNGNSLTVAELEAIESAIRAWAVERDQRSRRDTTDSAEINNIRVAPERSPQRRAALQPQPTWCGEASRRLLPRSQSNPPQQFVPAGRQTTSSDGPTLTQGVRRSPLQRSAQTDFQASCAPAIDSDEEDIGLQCSECGALSVKTVRGPYVPQSPLDGMHGSCVLCRNQRVVVIRRYLRCVLPQTAAPTSITSARVIV